MRRLVFALLLGSITGILPGLAQDNTAPVDMPSTNAAPAPISPAPPVPAPDDTTAANPPSTNTPPTSPAPTDASGPTVLQTYDGAGSLTTDPFHVQNQWEVRWTCQVPMTITVYSADHAVVAGTAGVHSGSFFLASGGTYYLQIDGPKPPPANARQDTPTTDNTTTTNAPPVDSSGQQDHQASLDQLFKWKVQVVTIGATETPAAPPDSTDAASTPPAPVVKLTDEQAQAIVHIQGDNYQGLGFLVKTPDGPVVVTNLHLIGNNPNLKILTSSGAQIPMLSAKGAIDRDLALLSIDDANYSYLEASTNINRTVLPGDDIITSGNSQDGQSTPDVTGKVLELGPEQIEFDNLVYQGSSGGPVLHIRTSKVLGVVTEMNKMDISHLADKGSFPGRFSAMSHSAHYSGLRLDTVTGWVPIDWKRFQLETTFLDQFHESSLCLDAYLNSPGRERPRGAGDAFKYYLKDPAIMKANANFLRQVVGADASQRYQGLKGLVFDLNAIADANMDQIQDKSNFYPFDQVRAQDEIAYRKALRAELDAISSNDQRLFALPRPNN